MKPKKLNHYYYSAEKEMQTAQQFVSFVNSAPSPFHAVAELSAMLQRAGFSILKERADTWTLQPGRGYVLHRNESALIAFAVGGQYRLGNGMSVVAAHTDSPCLKLKPRSRKQGTPAGTLQVGVQCYGGGLWHTWFDRDLGLAGRVILSTRDKNGAVSQVQSRLVNVRRPILRIPSLAIHLDRSVRDKFEYNTETHLTPVLALAAEDLLNRPSSSTDNDQHHHHPLLLNLLSQELKCDVADIHDFELCLYDVNPSCLGGAHNEFIHSARLDNLLMSYCSVAALLSAQNLDQDDTVRVIALFDNEEVGSDSAYGAGSNFLESFFRRFVANFPKSTTDATMPLSLDQVLQRSFLVSADMAHALHPNYAEKHDSDHRPIMGQGPVIKVNANQRYATTSLTSSLFKFLLSHDPRTSLPHSSPNKMTPQEFVVRNDVPCGSTIGPIVSTSLGMRTIDVGWGMWSMHSIRETCATSDVKSAIEVFTRVFEGYSNATNKFQVE